MRLWKVETTIGLLDRVRCALGQRFPECLDLGLRIASAKGTACEMGYGGQRVPSFPAVLYVTDDERQAIEAAAAAAGIDLTYTTYGSWRKGGEIRGARFSERKARTDLCR